MLSKQTENDNVCGNLKLLNSLQLFFLIADEYLNNEHRSWLFGSKSSSSSIDESDNQLLNTSAILYELKRSKLFGDRIFNNDAQASNSILKLLQIHLLLFKKSWVKIRPIICNLFSPEAAKNDGASPRSGMKCV